MSNQNVVDVAPRIRFLQSMRYVGYPLLYAISDIVDNAIDAEAENILVRFYTDPNGRINISISDDGSGMSAEVLAEALRMGSDLPKVSGKNGKFGMGLCTASLSLTPSFSVISKDEDGNISGLKHDLEYMEKTGSFSANVISEEDAAKIFNDDQFGVAAAGSGTIVILESCDQLGASVNAEHLVGNGRTSLKTGLGRIYRRFLDAGLSINVVNDGSERKVVEVSSVDPLEWDKGETEQIDEGDIEYKLPSGMVARIHYRLAIVEFESNRAERERGRWIQGFSIIRNNREIMKDATLGLFTKHSNFNHFRGEISFTDSLDDEMGVNFSKQAVDMSQSLGDVLREHLKAQLIHIQKRIQQKVDARKQVIPEQEEEIRKAEAAIIEKSSLLEVPNGIGNKTPSDNTNIKKTTGGSTGRATTGRGKARAKKARGVKFILVDNGARANFYDANLKAEEIEVVINTGHPFYKRYSVDGALPDSTLMLLYCFAAAELKCIDDEDKAILFDNFIGTMSNNLRSLWA